MKRIMHCVAILLLLSFVLTGCGNNNLAAEVDGEKITKADFQARLEIQKNNLAAQGLSFEGEQGASMLKMLEEQVINEMIQEKVILKEAGKLNLKIDEKKAQEEIDKFKKAYGEEQFSEILKQQKQTEAELKKVIAVQILSNEYFEKVTENIKVTEDDAKAYYDKNKNDLTQLKVSHIIKEVTEDAKPEDEAKAKAKIAEIISQLEKGADFAELAKKESDEPAAKTTGGSLEGFFRKIDGQYDPLFVDAALKIPKGSFNKEPVKTSFGYHVIKVEDKIDDFAKMKDDLIEELKMEKKNTQFQEEFQKKMDSAKIKNYIVKDTNEQKEAK